LAVAKSSGLGAALLVGGVDLSGDTQSASKVSGSQATIDLTSIDKFAYVRVGGIRDGELSWTSFYNPTGAHPVLAALPTADVAVMYQPIGGGVIGNPAFNLIGKQIGYDGNRDAAGAYLLSVQALANAYGAEWGRLLTSGTSGIRTDSAAANGASVDDGAGNAPSAFGLQAYLHVVAFTGTDVTVKLQDSADNSSFADVAGAAFTQITGGAPSYQRLVVSNAANVRRYLRASTVTTGGFSNLQFAVSYIRNPVAGQVF
jgi:hypothetical protein